MLEALGEHEVDAGRGLRDQRRVSRVRGSLLQRVANGDNPAVDRADEQDEDGEQGGNGQDDDEPADDRAPPQPPLR